jgi:hypothetical protein
VARAATAVQGVTPEPWAESVAVDAAVAVAAARAVMVVLAAVAEVAPAVLVAAKTPSATT